MSLSIRKGTSQSQNPAQAARELYEALHQPDIKLAVFYCPADGDLPALAAELYKLFKDINLIGCTTAGEITPIGYLKGAITGVSIASPTMEAMSQLISLEGFDSNAAGASVTALLSKLSQGQRTPASPADTFAFMLIDGLAGQEEQVVSCVHQNLHGIELIGGSAADDVRFDAKGVADGLDAVQRLGEVEHHVDSLLFHAERGNLGERRRLHQAHDRLDLHPYLSWSFVGSAWFVRPEIGYRHTRYELDREHDRSLSRGVSIASLDPGLFFDHTGEDVVTWERCKGWISCTKTDWHTWMPTRATLSPASIVYSHTSTVGMRTASIPQSSAITLQSSGSEKFSSRSFAT